MAGLALLLLPVATASAHAYLAQSNPADGAVLNTAPTQLRIGFSESVVLGATSLELVDGSGTTYAPTGLRLVTASPDAGTEEPVAVVADLPPLPHHTYRLSWRTLSSDDLHRTSGVIIFGIGRQVSGAGLSEPTPPITEAALRWVMFTAIAAALGGLLARRLYRGVGAGRDFERRAGHLSALGCLLGASAAGLLLFSQVHAAGVGISDVLAGRYGLGWTTRELGFVALAALAIRPARPGVKARARAGAVVAGAFAVTLGNALTGHAAAAGPTRIAADATHLSAAALWAGGLGALLITAAPAWRHGGQRAAARSAFIAFGRPAAWSAAALIASGVYLLSGAVGSVDAGLETIYGRLLLIKIGIFAVALSFGWRNHRRLRRSDRRTPLRTITAEAAAAAVILAFAAILTSSQPALEPQYLRPAGEATVPVLAAAAADLQQTLAVRPDQAGPNLVLLEIFNTRRPAPAPITQVTVQLLAPAQTPGPPIAAQQLTDDRWSVPLDLPTSGTTHLQVTVHRAGLPDVTSRFGFTVAGAPVAGQRPILISQTSLKTWFTRAAVLLTASLLAALAVGLTLTARRRRRRPGRPSAQQIPPPAGTLGRQFADAGARAPTG